MSETAQKPTVRFKGFTDPWEQRKVGDHLIESKTKGHTGNSARKITVKLWGKGVVEKNDFGGSEHTQYYERKSGQFIYSKLDFLNAAFGVIPEKLDKYESTADLPAFDPVEINPHFMCFRAIQKDFYLKNGMIADGSRKAKRIHVNVFQAMPISVPSLDEQDKIVTFLQAIDNLITLHQRKYEKLVDVKKALLEKMFPADGENVPQIRFRGFTDPWEQRKFAELYSLASEGGTPDTNVDDYYRNGTIPFVRIEDTQNKYIDSVKTFITDDGLRHSSAWLVPSYNVIFTNGATVGNVAINRIPVATKQGILGIIPNKTVTTEYLYYLLSASFFQREVRNRQATGTFATIILKNLNEINVFVPEKLEQQKISNYLSSIDILITLHQRKLEKLKNIKKALLDKMFV